MLWKYEITLFEMIHPCKHNDFLIQKNTKWTMYMGRENVSQLIFNNNIHQLKTLFCSDILMWVHIFYNKINLYCYFMEMVESCVQYASFRLLTSAKPNPIIPFSSAQTAFVHFNKESCVGSVRNRTL